MTNKEIKEQESKKLDRMEVIKKFSKILHNRSKLQACYKGIELRLRPSYMYRIFDIIASEYVYTLSITPYIDDLYNVVSNDNYNARKVLMTLLLAKIEEEYPDFKKWLSKLSTNHLNN